jgi:hypothetical protein
MPTQPDKYTVWNQAVEAVEIYLASNPRELTEDQIVHLCRDVQQILTGNASTGIELGPTDLRLHRLIDDRMQLLLSQRL